MTSNVSASFIERHTDLTRKAETLTLAQYVGRKLISTSSTMFIVSGTTGYEIANVVLREVRSAHIITNSVPIAWKFMQLEEDGLCAPHVHVTIVGGSVKAVTGAISGKINTDCSATLICAPHSLTERAIIGNRDVEDIKKLVDRHQNLIMPVSWRKFGRPGNYLIKHYGHWKQVQCQLVLTEFPHPDLGVSDAERTNGEMIIDSIKEALGDRLTVHRVPFDKSKTHI